jgi:hypothetical protein
MNTVQLIKEGRRWIVLMNVPPVQTVLASYRTKREALEDLPDWKQIAAVHLGGHIVNN